MTARAPRATRGPFLATSAPPCRRGIAGGPAAPAPSWAAPAARQSASKPARASHRIPHTLKALSSWNPQFTQQRGTDKKRAPGLTAQNHPPVVPFRWDRGCLSRWPGPIRVDSLSRSKIDYGSAFVRTTRRHPRVFPPAATRPRRTANLGQHAVLVRGWRTRNIPCVSSFQARARAASMFGVWAHLAHRHELPIHRAPACDLFIGSEDRVVRML